jgi:ribose 5-phosphate isomerase B
MRISIGCDHAAFELKEKVKQYLSTKKGIELNDWGCYSEERCDYPDFGHAVAEDVNNKKCDFGILMCGSGNGINMTANKWSGVRSALCWNSEIANMARLHNDANILTLPGRYISEEEAFKCVDEFLNTGFEGGRHSDRISKISNRNLKNI